MSEKADLRVIAVDWSGSKSPSAQRRTIWKAEMAGGRIVSLEGGHTRDQVVDQLIATASESPRLIVGLDFAFSLPAWYFLFIPPGVPHRPRNLSDTEPATAVVARNDARDEDRVVPYSASSRNRVPATGLS